MTEEAFAATGDIAKRDDALRVVWGWASVIEENGIPVIDTQGDMIEAAELRKAAHTFVTEARTGGVMHTTDAAGNPVKIGEIVESVVFTEEIQKALGIDLGRVGWWIGVRVTDDAVWEQAKAGKFTGFSIGGRGTRTALEG